MTIYFKKCLLILFYLVSLSGRTSTPAGVKPISNFDIQKYLETVNNNLVMATRLVLALYFF